MLIVVALVVVGPKDLPRLMGEVGRWTKKARAMADQLRASFDDMAHQSELDELRKEIDAMKTGRPMEGVRSTSNQSFQSPGIIPSAIRMNDGEANTMKTKSGRMELVEAATD